MGAYGRLGALSRNFWIQKVCWHHSAMFALFPQVNFPANNLNFHWSLRWWDWIQAIFLNLFYFKSKIKEKRKSKSEWDLHDSSSESDSISLVVTNRNLDTQQSQYFDALDTIEENEEESTDDDLSDLDVSFSMTLCRYGVWIGMKVLGSDSIILGTRKLWQMFPIKQKLNITAAFFIIKME